MTSAQIIPFPTRARPSQEGWSIEDSARTHLTAEVMAAGGAAGLMGKPPEWPNNAVYMKGWNLGLCHRAQEGGGA